MKHSLIEIHDMYNRRIRILEESNGEDYWQTPAETIMHLTGDCEDFAIAKYYSLQVFGYDMTQWEIHAVRLKAEFHGGLKGQLINHAILVNNKDGWALDNLTTEIVKLPSRIDISETYAKIAEHLPSPYKQWQDMLSRRNPTLDKELIENLFSV